MALQVGIIGLPNSGKSTIFNALTRAGAQVAGYPFSTVDPNYGVAPVPDDRLHEVASAAGCHRTIPADMRMVDIAGLVEGAHRGEGLGNQFLAHVREVDALAHAVRLFTSPDVAHVMADIAPRRDIGVVNTELILADLAAVERRKGRISKAAKTGDRDKARELELLERVEAELDQEVPVRGIQLSTQEAEILSGLFLLTAKPVIYVANVGEDQLGEDGPLLREVRDIASSEGAELVAFSARLESEIEEMEPDEVEEFLEAYGIEGLGLAEFAARCYVLLGLITFFTGGGPDEVRAWSVPNGIEAQKAAGKIHTDMEKGFIRAEVTTYDDLVKCGSFSEAKKQGVLRLEGKTYPVHDGDVITFLFNV